MQLHNLKSPKGARKKRRRVGRGAGSGRGKTSGRGENGQGSRTGRGIVASSEGGQMPLIRRLPKVGFRSRRPIVYQLVKLKSLSRFEEGATIDAKTLKDNGLIKNICKPFKVLGDGDIKKALTVKAYSFSKSAEEKVVKAGGKVEKINKNILKKETAVNQK